MSDQPPPFPSPTPRARHPVLTFLLVAAGIILLLPGLCSLAAYIILFGNFAEALHEPGFMAILVVCLAISAGGVLLIRYAVRRS